MRTKHYMVDLETFSTEHYGVPISLGAALFDVNGTGVKDRFYVCIDPIDAEKRGLRVMAETVMWWMQPEQRPAYDQWYNTLKFPLELALSGFKMWMDGHDELDPPDPEYPAPASGYQIKHRMMWSNASTFDDVLIRQYYKVLNQDAPWGFRGDHCFRTLKNSAVGPHCKPEFEGMLHNASDDAYNQALWLQNICRAIGLTY